MDNDAKGYLNRNDFPEKETYTQEEKQMIMDRLNEERLSQQRIKERLDGTIKSYTEEEKSKILVMINEQRLSKQHRDDVETKRAQKKEKYKLGMREYYKFTKMEREYYMEVKELENISNRPIMVSLYYRTCEDLIKKEVLIKTEVHSEYFFISFNPIRIYFKPYALEDEQ